MSFAGRLQRAITETLEQAGIDWYETRIHLTPTERGLVECEPGERINKALMDVVWEFIVEDRQQHER